MQERIGNQNRMYPDLNEIFGAMFVQPPNEPSGYVFYTITITARTSNILSEKTCDVVSSVFRGFFGN